MYILLDSTFFESITSSVIASGLFMVLFTAFSAWIAILIKRRLKRRKKKNKPQKSPCKVLSNFSPINKDEVIGREDDLTAISLKLENTNTILLLNGMGGIGKTTLATLYAQTHKDEYEHLVWINAAQGIQKGFVSDTTLTHHFGLTEALQQLQEQQPDSFEEQGTELLLNALLDKTNGLLIIDNEQQEQSIINDVKAKLQGSGNWKILITAREMLTGVEPYEVDVLNEDDARKLFYQYYTKEQNDTLVDEINELLLHHTLMVELMARVAQNRDGFSLTQLKGDLETTKLNFAKDDKVESNHWGTGDTKTQRLNAFLQTAFTIAEFEIQESDSENQKTEKQQLHQLLTYWCLMPERLPIELDSFCILCSIPDEDKNETNTHLNHLVKTGWLQKDNEEYLMHPVIQQALRWQLHPQPQNVEGLVGSLNEQMNFHFDKKHTLIGAFYLQPYIQSVLRYFYNPNHFTRGDYTEDWLTIANLTNNNSLYLKYTGNYNKALEFALKDISITEEVLEPKHPSLATSYSNIATIYQDKGDLEKALEFAVKDISIREEVLEPKHPSLATSYNNIAVVYQDKGDLEKALEFSVKALTIKEEVLEPKHPSLATSYNNIATIYNDKSNLDKALEFALKALTISEEVFEPKHPNLANSYNNIAVIYQNKGDLEKALELAVKALTIREEVLEPKHPELAISYNNIALIYKDKGDYSTAKKYIDQAVEIIEYNFPNGHPNLDISKRTQKAIEEKLKGS
jgi:tetratricopeptide (TPR) repeat protein